PPLELYRPDGLVWVGSRGHQRPLDLLTDTLTDPLIELPPAPGGACAARSRELRTRPRHAIHLGGARGADAPRAADLRGQHGAVLRAAGDQRGPRPQRPAAAVGGGHLFA